MLEALNTILEVGIDAVPGGAVANGAKTAVQGAKSFAENGLTAASFFDNWIGDACGVPDWNFDLFGALLGAPDSMGTSIGCKRKNKADCKKVDSVPDPTKKPTQDSKPTTQDNTPPKSTLTEPTVTHPTTTGPTTLQKSTTETTATGRTTSQGTSTTASATTSGVCNLKRANNPERKGGNTIVSTECNAGATTTHAYMITSLEYAANAQPTQVTATCRNQWAQACYHYSSAISVNAQWATLTCPPAAATKSRKRLNAKATATWSSQHRGKGWQDTAHRAEPNCERDEYPPAYLLSTTDTAFVNAGKDTTGQSVRWLPASQNGAAANGMWAGQCFKTPLNGLTDQQLYDKASDPAKNFGVKPNVKSPSRSFQTQPATRLTNSGNTANQTFPPAASTEYEVGITVESRPEFTIVAWEHGNPQSPSKDDGLSENPCWPKAIAPQDPGFTLLTFDKYYNGNKPPYDYTQPYVPGKNGVKRDLELEDYETLGREFNATFTGE